MSDAPERIWIYPPDIDTDHGHIWTKPPKFAVDDRSLAEYVRAPTWRDIATAPKVANRVTYDDDGKHLDEVVTDGGMHLENLGGKRWFLSGQRSDGSEICLWFTGKITGLEDREPPKGETE